MDCWLSAGMKRKIADRLGLSFEEFLDRMDVDLRYISGPELKQGHGAFDPAKSNADIWGVPRRVVSVRIDDTEGGEEAYKEVETSPLEPYRSVEELAEYGHWPSADWYDYSDIERQCDEIRNKNRVVVFMGDRLNRLAQLKPAMYLRGYEQILMDLYINPEIATEIFRRIREFYLEYGARILEAARGKIDILCTGDDFGTQNGLLISAPLWREFLQQGFSDLIALGKEHGARTMHHTCGSVIELIPDLIASGLDILQSLQPEAKGMAPADLKSRFGRDISFQGGISIQSVLPHGSLEDVRRHVESVLREMATGGGYIACTSHNIQADVPIKNVEELFEAYKTYGSYAR